MVRFLASRNFCLYLLACLVLLPSMHMSAQGNPPAQNNVQDASSPDFNSDRVFAPFVSKLRVAVKDPQVRLTWQDIPDFEGSYQIYRYTEEIGVDNLAKATLVGEISQGDQFFTDIPADSGKYFYAVLARDPNGTDYQVFIPFRNKTLGAIAVNVTPASQDLPSEISNFQAAVKGAAIQVDLASSRNIRNVAIFRSTRQMLTPEDLTGAIQVWSGTGRLISYLDYAVPGVPYYYAAVDIAAFQQGTISLEVDRNSLSRPVEIPLGQRQSILAGLNTPRTVRIMPLPVLTLPDLSDSQPILDGTNPVQVNTALAPAVKSNIAKLTANLHSPSQAKPKPAEVLPSDRLQLSGKLSNPIQGEAKVLTEILAKYFTKHNWDESTRQLNNFLSLPISSELVLKGHFYLAESYYQTGHYREALLEFLFIQDELPEFAQPWIDNTLALSSQW